MSLTVLLAIKETLTFFIFLLLLCYTSWWEPVLERKTWRPYLGWLSNCLKAVHFYREHRCSDVVTPVHHTGSGRSSPKIDFMTRMKTKKTSLQDYREVMLSKYDVLSVVCNLKQRFKCFCCTLQPSEVPCYLEQGTLTGNNSSSLTS